MQWVGLLLVFVAGLLVGDLYASRKRLAKSWSLRGTTFQVERRGSVVYVENDPLTIQLEDDDADRLGRALVTVAAAVKRQKSANINSLLN